MSEPTQLDRIEHMLIAVIASIEAGQARHASAPNPAPSNLGPIDLDSAHGNFVIKKDPPRWKGKSYAGKKLSETEPEYLDTLSGFRLWQAGKDREAGKDPKWSELDAARCAGWATRLRSGWKSKSDGLVPDDDDSPPF